MSTKLNIVIDQGADYSQPMSLADSNGDSLEVTYANGAPIYTANASMRKTYSSLNAVSFDTTLSNGSFTLSMAANVTSTLEGGRYVYDVKLTGSNNNTTRILEGIVTVNPEVTKS